MQLFGPTFDILGFDPRGVGATTPQAQCFDSPEESDAWNLPEVVAVCEGDGTIPLARARDEVLASLCAEKLGGNGREDLNGTAEEWGPGRFMDSASVATDMLKITEKLGQEKLQYFGGVSVHPALQILVLRIHLCCRATVHSLDSISLLSTRTRSAA